MIAYQNYRFGPELTKEQAKCYADRYTDIKTGDTPTTFETIQSHWQNTGIAEKRNKLCVDDLTDEEAKCYIDRYPDIKFD